MKKVYLFLFLVIVILFGCKANEEKPKQIKTEPKRYPQNDEYVGSTLSMRYHYIGIFSFMGSIDCEYAKNIPEECMVSFQTGELARKQGFVPCRICIGRDSTETAKPDTSVYLPPANASTYPIKWRTRIEKQDADEE